MTTETYSWVEFKFEFDTKNRIPKWARRAAVSSDGTVFLSSAVAGDPMTVLAYAGYDGTPALFWREHAYYPADWIARTFPKSTDAAIRLTEQALAFLAKNPETPA